MVGDRRRLALAAALLAAGVGAAALAVLLARGGDDPRGGRYQRPEAVGWFEPDVHAFGAPVTARAELVVQKNEIRRNTLEVEADIAPYEIVGTPTRETFDLGGAWRIRYTLTLRCVERECLPDSESREFQFPAFRLSWRFPPPPGTKPQYRTEQFTTQRTSGTWPPLKVTTRIARGDLDDGRWRAGIETLPAVTYRVSPGALLAVLVALAVVLVGVAAACVAVYVRRRVREAEASAHVEEERRTPLEEALLLVSETRRNGDGRARMALDGLADELRGAGAPELALDAQRLAWSPAEPDDDAIAELATKVRVALEDGAR